MGDRGRTGGLVVGGLITVGVFVALVRTGSPATREPSYHSRQHPGKPRDDTVSETDGGSPPRAEPPPSPAITTAGPPAADQVCEWGPTGKKICKTARPSIERCSSRYDFGHTKPDAAYREHWDRAEQWLACGVTAGPFNAELPCQDYGYPKDFFTQYWTAPATQDLPVPTTDDAFARVLAWFARNVPTTVEPAAKRKPPAWHSLLPKHRDDLVYPAHDWESAEASTHFSSHLGPLCTHLADLKAGTMTAITGDIPKCDGSVVCADQATPVDFGKRPAELRALLKKASPSGPVVVVTTRTSTSFKTGWGVIGGDSIDAYGSNVPELAAWYSQAAIVSGSSKLRALPGGYTLGLSFKYPRPFDSVVMGARQHTLLVTFSGDATSPTRAGVSFCAREYWPFATVIPGGLVEQVLVKKVGRNTTAIALSTLNLYAKFKFLLSPCSGKEVADCAETWDALYVGTIPIVRRGGCPADKLWEDLPVLVVSSFDEVSKELLDRTWADFSTRKFQLDRLRLQFYAERIRNAAHCRK